MTEVKKQKKSPTSFELWARADSFYECGLVCLENKHPAKRNLGSGVSLYAFCHAIELGLKAFLVNRGVSIEVLRKHPLRHDLLTLLRRAKTEGIQRHCPTAARIWPKLTVLNRVYKAKEFEYPAEGLRKIIGASEACSATYLLLLELKGICGVSRPQCPTKPADFARTTTVLRTGKPFGQTSGLWSEPPQS